MPERFVLTTTRYGKPAVLDRDRSVVAPFVDAAASVDALHQCWLGRALTYQWRPAHEEELV